MSRAFQPSFLACCLAVKLLMCTGQLPKLNESTSYRFKSFSPYEIHRQLQPVRHLQMDKYIPGNIILASGNAIWTTKLSQAEFGLELIAGHASDSGYVEGTSGDARFNKISSFVQLEEGGVILADKQNNVIRRLNRTTNHTSLLAGGIGGFSSEDGSLLIARLKTPDNIVKVGNVYYISQFPASDLRKMDLRLQNVVTVELRQLFPAIGIFIPVSGMVYNEQDDLLYISLWSSPKGYLFSYNRLAGTLTVVRRNAPTISDIVLVQPSTVIGIPTRGPNGLVVMDIAQNVTYNISNSFAQFRSILQTGETAFLLGTINSVLNFTVGVSTTSTTTTPTTTSTTTTTTTPTTTSTTTLTTRTSRTEVTTDGTSNAGFSIKLSSTEATTDTEVAVNRPDFVNIIYAALAAVAVAALVISAIFIIAWRKVRKDKIWMSTIKGRLDNNNAMPLQQKLLDQSQQLNQLRGEKLATLGFTGMKLQQVGSLQNYSGMIPPPILQVHYGIHSKKSMDFNEMDALKQTNDWSEVKPLGVENYESEIRPLSLGNNASEITAVKAETKGSEMKAAQEANDEKDVKSATNMEDGHHAKRTKRVKKG